MSVETRSQTVAEEVDSSARPNNSEESVPLEAAAGALPVDRKSEPSNLQRETFVIERTDTGVTADAIRPAGPSQAEAAVALFDRNVAQDFRSRWNEIQVAFVDEPRDAVGRADQLVAATIKQLSESFTAERQRLEGEWDRGADDSTEALRLAFQRYRSFFNRLLSV